MGRLIDINDIRVKPMYMQNIMGVAMIRCEDLSRILADIPSVTPQEPILDKIRAEIEMEKLEDSPNFCIKAHNNAVERALQIIDKYKVERKESNENISSM